MYMRIYLKIKYILPIENIKLYDYTSIICKYKIQ